MKDRKLLVITIFILLIMGVTNPSKDDYVSWTRDQVVGESTYSFGKASAAKVIASDIENSTTATNLVFISIYETKLGNDSGKTLGMFKGFIPLNENNWILLALTLLGLGAMVLGVISDLLKLIVNRK